MQPLLQPPPMANRHSDHPVHKTIASAANLANLLPSGTVLVFQALIPTFSNNGTCHIPDRYLTGSAIIFCAVICIFSSFTDSFTGKDGKVYYGVATFRGLYVFNKNDDEEGMQGNKLGRFKISLIDFVHALLSLLVFLIFALSSSDVRNCFLRDDVVRNEIKEMMQHLPLGAGIMSSFVFTVFPTTRRGVGFPDLVPRQQHQHSDGLVVTTSN